MNIEYEHDFIGEDNMRYIVGVKHTFTDIDWSIIVPYGLVSLLMFLAGGVVSSLTNGVGVPIVIMVILPTLLIVGAILIYSGKKKWRAASPSAEDISKVKKIVDGLTDCADLPYIRSVLNKGQLCNKDLESLALVLDEASRKKYRQTVNDMAKQM